jgi:glycine/D-amino acid oxidase-like deaminating enzyme
VRVAVVGAGIVGACAAWELTRRRAEVSVFDAGEPGEGVTNWSFSWANASSETDDRRYFDLRVAALGAWRDLASCVGGYGWWHPDGHLWWAATSGTAALRERVDRLSSWGYAAELWPLDRVRRLLEPEVVFTGGGSEAAFFPDEGWIGGHALVRVLLDEATRGGAQVYTGRQVTDVALSGGAVAGIGLADGRRYPVDAIVNAAGPAAPGVAALVGRRVLLRDAPGIIARLACNGVPVGRSVHAPGVGLRPDGDNRVAVHSREVDARIGPGVSPRDLADELRRRAVDIVPSLEDA